MNLSSLEHKTVRPGNLVNYSYYHGENPTAEVPKVNKTRVKIYLLVFLILLTVPIFYSFKKPSSNVVNGVFSTSSNQNTSSLVNNCAGNNLAKFVKVSVSRRKLWACTNDKLVYSSPVITGISTHPDTSTPLGTYKIQSKSQNINLTGSDSVSSWDDPVKYWMPFLTNNFGTYGFHDATWRNNNSFGNVDSASNNASHGCIELPLSTANWLYSWLDINSTVTVTT